MKINLDYFDGMFHEKRINYHELKPFSHVDVAVNCKESVCTTQNQLENNVVSFLNKKLYPLGLKCRWDLAEEWYRASPNSSRTNPTICELGMGINIDLINL